MNQKTAVLFDLDGTLIDTAPDFAIVLNQLLNRHNKAALDYPTIRACVSNGSGALITLAFGLTPNDAGFTPLRNELLDLYETNLCIETKLFDELDQTLDWIEQQSLAWGVVTNKPYRYAKPIIKGLGLEARCSALVCPDHVTHTKPDPEPLRLALSTLNAEAKSSIYIGDHIRDIQAGKNAGMQTIATGYGYIDEQDNIDTWQADHTINKSTELLPLLKSLLNH